MRNKLSKVILAGVMLGLAVASANAAAIRFAGASTAGTGPQTNVGYYIVSAKEKAGVPAVEYLNLTADVSTATVKFYRNTTNRALNAASSGTTNILRVAAGGTSFSNGTVVVIQHVATDTYERNIVLGTPTATAITLTNATLSAVAVGDVVWLQMPNGSLGSMAGLTKEYAPPNPLHSGEDGQPLLVEVSGAGTNSPSINAIAGSFRFEVINGVITK